MNLSPRSDAISLGEFAATLEHQINTTDILAGVHPSARCVVHEYIGEMQAAAREGNAAEVARLARNITEKISDEKKWHAHCLRSAHRRVAT